MYILHSLYILIELKWAWDTRVFQVYWGIKYSKSTIKKYNFKKTKPKQQQYKTTKPLL